MTIWSPELVQSEGPLYQQIADQLQRDVENGLLLPGSRLPTLVWGIIAALVGAGWWFVFHRWKKWYVWFAAAIPFLVVLFVFYTYLERLLPSNY